MTRFIVLAVFACLVGCSEERVQVADLVGTWKSSDGAEVTLKADGTWEGHSLPMKVLFRAFDDLPPRMAGNGGWRLDKGVYWTVTLAFDEPEVMTTRSPAGVHVDPGGSSTYLFAWVGEEGGARYHFKRQK